MTPLLLILGVLALATTALIRFRTLELARPLPEDLDTERPLAPSELLRLHAWQGRLRRSAAALALAYLFLVATSLLDLEPPPGRAAVALALLGAGCLLAVSIQFSEHCPRCGFNLGFHPRLVLPESCARCGGHYP